MTQVESEISEQLKSEDFDSMWEVYKTKKLPNSMCKAESQKNETHNLEAHYQDSQQQGFE